METDMDLKFALNICCCVVAGKPDGWKQSVFGYAYTHLADLHDIKSGRTNQTTNLGNNPQGYKQIDKNHSCLICTAS